MVLRTFFALIWAISISGILLASCQSAFLDSIPRKILCFRSDLCMHVPSLFEPISKASCICSKLIDWFLVEESCFHHRQPLSHGEF
jgi:hypothetical protein